MLMRLPYDTRHLRLRLLRDGDLTAFHAYRSDADVARYQGWSPMSLSQAAQFIASQRNHPRLLPGNWIQIAIAERVTDQLLGDLGICVSPDEAEAEFGLSISPEAQGKGHATEAVRGLIELLFAIKPISRIVANTDVRNLPCIAVLQRVGMHCVGTRRAEYKGEECEESLFCLRKNQS